MNTQRGQLSDLLAQRHRRPEAIDHLAQHRLAEAFPRRDAYVTESQSMSREAPSEDFQQAPSIEQDPALDWEGIVVRARSALAQSWHMFRRADTLWAFSPTDCHYDSDINSLLKLERYRNTDGERTV